ncbi:hypothetical protein [Streptomyces mirabilis]|uniref:hypothetical protein n=1 Tax=Streptomyces mirabilis TaxID=68239 RepID=UPI0036633B71
MSTGELVSAQEASTVRERLMERTCEWCGAPIAYAGRGRPPRYCRPAHRRHAWEMRTARERAARPVSEGGQDQQPVREVVERTVTVVRAETVVRTVVGQGQGQVRIRKMPAKWLSRQPCTLPEDAVEWVQALAYLRRAAGDPQIAPFPEQLARACERTARALRSDGPDAPLPDRLPDHS